MVKKMKRELFCKILNSEMQLATGCTEPGSGGIVCSLCK